MESGWFDGVGSVVHDDLRFKARLGIGDDAYTSVRVKKALFEAWDVAGVAATGAQVASSALVAQKFFAAPSLLASLGIGTATAATPIGWVVAASVISGGAWLGITRYLKTTSAKSKVIPEFINTPLDVLGIGLFDLMAPLAMKVAHIDGQIDPSERETIRHHLVYEWGYSEDFVERGLAFVTSRLDDYHVGSTAKTLAAFSRDNPDCNFDAMCQDTMAFIRDVTSADGQIDEREEMALERIAATFAAEGKFSFKRAVAPVQNAAATAAGSVSLATQTIRSRVFRKDRQRDD